MQNTLWLLLIIMSLGVMLAIKIFFKLKRIEEFLEGVGSSLLKLINENSVKKKLAS